MSNSQRTLEILGASFDPPHIGHAQLVKGVLHLGIAERIKLIPAKEHPFSKKMSSPEHRLAMLELFSREFSGLPVEIDTYELEKEGVSYSYQTLRHFAGLEPETMISWLIGSDNVKSFPKWFEYQALLDTFPVHVYPRPGYPVDGLLDGMIPLTGLPEIAASSTEVRERVGSGQDVAHLVEALILEYIVEHSLYQK